MHCPVHNPCDTLGHVWDKISKRRAVARQSGLCDVSGRTARTAWPDTAESEERSYPEAVDVRVDRASAAAKEFGGGCVLGALRIGGASIVHQGSKAKVTNECDSFRRYEDVLGFDVSVKKPRIVYAGDARCGLLAPAEHLLDPATAGFGSAGEVTSLGERRRHIAKVESRDDGGVEHRERELTLEVPEQLGLSPVLSLAGNRLHELEGDLLVEVVIEHLVHVAVLAGPKMRPDLVAVVEKRANGQGGRL